MGTKDQREAFETWCKGRHSIIRAENEDFYLRGETDFAWQAWQAALASRAAVPSDEVVERYADEIQRVCFESVDGNGIDRGDALIYAEAIAALPVEAAKVDE